MKPKQPLAKRVFAAGAVAALGLLGVVGVGGAAFAAVGPDQPGAPDSGSLTIHKRVGAQGADGGNGNVITPAPGDPLGGVEFKIWRLGTITGGSCTALDLSIATAWDSVPTVAAPALVNDTYPSGTTEGSLCVVPVTPTQPSPQTGNTSTVAGDDFGNLTFGGLPLGLYYVAETDASGAVDEAGDDVEVHSTSAPFYMTIPMSESVSGAKTGNWIYDVNAYPKNQILDEPTKVINEDSTQGAGGYVIGDTVTYTITQVVPALNAGEQYTSASIWDNLADELEFVETVSFEINGVPFLPGEYIETQNGTLNGVTWEVDADQLDVLVAGQTIKIVFKAKVTSVTPSGVIENPGGEIGEPGYGSEFNGEDVPGNPNPLTYWGVLKVTKVDNSTPAKGLAGAEFQIFAKGEAACAATAPTSGTLATGTSNAAGVVMWGADASATPPTAGTEVQGLFVANSNSGPLTAPTKQYCLYETVVPSGYTGVPVQTVTIGAGTTLTVGVNDLSVVNTPKDVPDLPLTGAQGTLAMTAGGLVLVGLGLGAYAIARRRQAARS